ncbi:MAG: transposase [Oscillatoria sp. SIO1A7]|nr:transposase [Oscillatoria sp. SIO1A7]
MKLRDRTFVCPNCGFFKDRDWNAAINKREGGKNHRLGLWSIKLSSCRGKTDASKQE